MTGFWIGMLIFILIVIGLSVAFGMLLNRGEGRRRRADPHDPMTALKASGALRHRKSNRP
ncbi:MAG: hypothetical protein JNK94_07435 [Hyphomonadaceae bacterium]|nr:hypothetical protein [Hyphomonadaceae bacterium]